jgi:hypothetical protein
VSSICPGLSIRPDRRGGGRRPSHLVDTQPIAAVADSLTAKPELLALLRRIDAIRGPCDESIEKEPGFNDLRSRHLVRFYSSYKRRKPDFKVYVLSKGDLVLDELDRRARLAATKASTQDTMIRLVVPDMKAAIAELDAVDGPIARRSRIGYAVR